MAKLFPVVAGDKTRSNAHQVKHKKFHLNMKNFFSLRVAEHWLCCLERS